MRKYFIAALVALAVAGGVVVYSSADKPAQQVACEGTNC